MSRDATVRTPPPRGFTNAEYQRRLEAVQADMASADLGALLLTTEADIRYVTGFLSQFWQSPTRPWFTVVPARGKPVAVIPEIGANAMDNGWMEDIRAWPSPHATDDGLTLLGDTLLEMLAHCGSRRLGLNQGRETCVRMPLGDFDALRARLASESVSLHDATAILRHRRMVKSEAEIDKIRHVAQCASDVFERLPGFVQAGMRDDEVFRAFKIECLKAGVDDVAYLVGGAGQGGYDDIISPPSGRVLSRGDVLILDTGCTFDGYFCDYDRNYAVGAVDDASRRAHEVVWQATEAGLAAVRPGARCTDVFAAMDAVMRAGGAMGESVGRFGHGLGMQLTEPPSHTNWDETVLEPGMVITLEPGMIFAPGRMMVHEENLVVRDDGPEMLSRRAPPGMPLIA